MRRIIPRRDSLMSIMYTVVYYILYLVAWTIMPSGPVGTRVLTAVLFTAAGIVAGFGYHAKAKNNDYEEDVWQG